jgi:hypothetical protein
LQHSTSFQQKDILVSFYDSEETGYEKYGKHFWVLEPNRKHFETFESVFDVSVFFSKNGNIEMMS